MDVQIYLIFAYMKISKKSFITNQQVCIKNFLYVNIVLLFREEELKKIIKIQSNIRGMEMRDKIKLKSKKKITIIQPEKNNSKLDLLKNEKNIIEETKENEKEKYEEIIVNKKYIFITIKYSQKKI